MIYKLMLLVAFIGLALFSYGYMQEQLMYQFGGFALTFSMFAIFMVRKLARKKS